MCKAEGLFVIFYQIGLFAATKIHKNRVLFLGRKRVGAGIHGAPPEFFFDA